MSVIEQFTYSMLIRRLDERQLFEEKKANMIGIPVQPPIYSSEQSELRWNLFKNKDPEAVIIISVIDGINGNAGVG